MLKHFIKILLKFILFLNQKFKNKNIHFFFNNFEDSFYFFSKYYLLAHFLLQSYEINTIFYQSFSCIRKCIYKKMEEIKSDFFIFLIKNNSLYVIFTFFVLTVQKITKFSFSFFILFQL